MLRSLLSRARAVEARHLAPGAAAFAAAVAVPLVGLYSGSEAPQAAPRGGEVVKVRLLGVNDLHGHLEPPRPRLGGAAWLKAHLDRATIPGRTIRVHAGDMVGASPLISSWFHDEPSIEAANAMGFDVGTVGNHEFDEGGEEMLRLLRGGRREGPEALKRDAAGELVNTSSPSFRGAAFPYLGANTFDRRSGRLLLPPYGIVRRAGVRVGFIGVTTDTTPQFLLRRHAEPLRFTDISEAVDRWVPELRRRGVEAIVVLAHAGAAAPAEGEEPGGEVIDEAREMSDAVDVVIAGHSHSPLDLRVPNRDGGGDKLVVEARSYGSAYDEVDLSIERDSGEVVAKSARVRATRHHRVSPDAGLRALVGRYAARVAPLADEVVARTTAPLPREGGDLAQLSAEAQRSVARTDVALVNAGSLREDLDKGPVTYAEVSEAQAYDHPVLRMRMAGSDVLRQLARGNIRASLRPGLRGGRAIDPKGTYTVAANELVATSAGFGELRRERSVGREIEVLARYLDARRRPIGR